MSELGERLLKLAITVAVAAFLLQWAWSMVLPLVPFAVIALIVYGAIRIARARQNYW